MAKHLENCSFSTVHCRYGCEGDIMQAHLSEHDERYVKQHLDHVLKKLEDTTTELNYAKTKVSHQAMVPNSMISQDVIVGPDWAFTLNDLKWIIIFITSIFLPFFFGLPLLIMCLYRLYTRTISHLNVPGPVAIAATIAYIWVCYTFIKVYMRRS